MSGRRAGAGTGKGLTKRRLTLWFLCVYGSFVEKEKKSTQAPGKQAWGGRQTPSHPRGTGGGGGLFQEQAVCTTASIRPSVHLSVGLTQRESRRESSATPLCAAAGERQREEARGPSGRLPSDPAQDAGHVGPTQAPQRPQRPAFVRSFPLCLAVGSSPRATWAGGLRWEMSGQLGGGGGLLLGSQDGQGEGREPRAPGQLEVADGGPEELLQSGAYGDPDAA